MNIEENRLALLHTRMWRNALKYYISRTTKAEYLLSVKCRRLISGGGEHYGY